MSSTTKYYSIRDRLNRYKKAVQEAVVGRYYTDSSKSQNRKPQVPKKPES
jgi:hypothetical protein